MSCVIQMMRCTKIFVGHWYLQSCLLLPGWKYTRNFVMRPYLRVRAPINAMRLIFMRNLRARVN